MATDRARQALIYFHNRNLKYSGYKITFDDLLTRLYKNRIPQQLAALNSALVISELPESDIKKMFEGFADEGRGRIPARTQDWFDAIRGEVSGIRWVDVKEIAMESASTIAQGVVSAGETVIDTAKSLQVILPIVVVGAVVFILYAKTRQIAGQ